MVCTGYHQRPEEKLICRFGDGTEALAQLDTETQRISCKLPQVSTRQIRFDRQGRGRLLLLRRALPPLHTCSLIFACWAAGIQPFAA